MIECKDCKIFSQQIEETGICPLDNFGIYQLNHRCKTGEIINSVYRRGRKNTIDEIRNLITQKLQTECHFKYCDDSDDCCEVNVLMWLDEQLKEQKNDQM